MSEEYFTSQTTSEEPRGYYASEGRQSFSTPLAGVSSGRLEFERGVANVRISSEADMPDLIRARFDGVIPRIVAEGGEISIRYPHYSFFDWLRYAMVWEQQNARLLLNSTVPWDIAVNGGLSRLQADIREVRLRSFTVHGGASSVYLRLGTPEGNAPVRIFGGASHLVIFRPVGVAARLHVHGGVSSVTLDDQHFSAIGGGTLLRSTIDSADRYDVEIYGGASVVTVATE